MLYQFQEPLVISHNEFNTRFDMPVAPNEGLSEQLSTGAGPIPSERLRMRPRRFGTLSLSLALLVPILAACGSSIFGVRGSGDVTTESREVSGFDEIALRGSGTVIVDVDGTESLTIEAEDNLLQYLTTEVVGGRLELEANRSISPTEDIVYTISAVSLEGLDVSGSGRINVSGVSGDRLDVNVSGSGSIDAPDLDVGSVSVDISGSGSVRIVGAADDLDLSISGSGEYEGAELVTASADVRVSGSGDAVVNVTDQLDASVSGSGNVEYLGDPSVTSSMSGSGNVSRR